MTIEEYNTIDLNILLTAEQVDSAYPYANSILKEEKVGENELVKAHIISGLQYLNNSKKQRAKKMLNLAFQKAETLQNKAKCYYYNARYYKFIGKLDLACKCIENSKYDLLSDKDSLKSEILLFAGILQEEIGNYVLAHVHYLEVNRILKKNKQSNYTFLINFSALAIRMLNFVQAKKLLLEALKLVKAENKKDVQIGIYCNLSIVYLNLGKHKKSIKIAKDALKLKEKLNDTSDKQLYVLNVMLICSYKVEDIEEIKYVITYFLKEDVFDCIQKQDKLFYLELISLIVLVIEKYRFKQLKVLFYKRLGQKKSALQIIKKTVNEYKKAKSISYYVVGCFLLYSYYMSIKDYEKACKYLIERDKVVSKNIYINNVNLSEQFCQVLNQQKYYQQKLNQEAILLQKSKDNKMLKSFLQAIAHDLKQPVRNLNTLSNLWPELKEEEEHDFLKHIIGYTDDLQTMINYILEVGDKVSFSKDKNTDLNLLVTSLIESLSHLINKENVSISYPVLPVLTLNSKMLHEVLKNIFLFSISSRKKEEIQNITIHHSYDSCFTLKIDVKNVDESLVDISSIFKWKTSKGSNVNLAFCKKMIEIENGKLSVAWHENKELQFRIKLPNINS